jgi:hypothetical protein
VLEFNETGAFVQGWGGSGDSYEWPDAEHGIYVDDQKNVWIGGSSRSGAGVCEPRCSRGDDMLLKFTKQGKFLLQIGRRDRSTGTNDTSNVHAATDVFVHRQTNELFVSDGYEGPAQQGNCRVVVFDAGSGLFKRAWGAFGNAPACLPDSPARAQAGSGPGPAQRAAFDTDGPGPQQFSTVHGIEVSRDGLVYVADRQNRRIQVFTLEGKYVSQVFINRRGPSEMSAAGIAFSHDPEQRFMYVADYGNSHVVVVERKGLKALYQFGDRSAASGNFQGIHNLAVDSRGNLYTAEVAPGNRAQRFAFKGLSSLPTR